MNPPMSSAAMVKLKKRGCPMDSVEAAQGWWASHVNVAARKTVVDVPPAAPRPAPARQVAGDDFGAMIRANEVRYDGSELSEDHQAARTRREISEANQSEMAEAKMRHDQILISAVQTVMSMDYAITRDSLLQMPARLAPLLAAEVDPVAIQTILHAELHQALLTLSGSADRMPDIAGGFD
jgi:hypothetical protein